MSDVSYLLSNEELQQAIETTFSSLAGEEPSSPLYILLFEHLEELLNIQIVRAGLVSTLKEEA